MSCIRTEHAPDVCYVIAEIFVDVGETMAQIRRHVVPVVAPSVQVCYVIAEGFVEVGDNNGSSRKTYLVHSSSMPGRVLQAAVESNNPVETQPFAQALFHSVIGQWSQPVITAGDHWFNTRSLLYMNVHASCMT